ncbi:MAG TPA: penicillin acylase family protein, partial [Pirellulaceae bacterium]
IWYEAILSWPDGYVMGASLPGVPLFAVARTPRLAWGVTYIKADTIDLFVEDCRRSESGEWQYRRGDLWHDFDVREEVIGRKQDTAVTLQVLENEVGTLDTEPSESGYYLSIAWTGRKLKSAPSMRIWLDLVHCPDVAQGMEVVAECDQPTLCFVFADREGHIGKQGCGRIPRRPNPLGGLAPLPAWDERNHWQGWLDAELLPSSYDPPEGFVASANEECNPPHGPLLVTQTVPDYRIRRIQGRLRELQRASVEDFQRLQYDVVSTQADDLLAIILPELPEGWLKERLANWDRGYQPESETAPIFQQLYRNLMRELLGHERGIGWRRMLYLCSRAGFSSMVLTAADRLWLRSDSWWWHGRNQGDLIRRAAEGVQDRPGVRWSDVNYFHFANRFLGQHRVGRLLGYNTRRHAMPGCYATPFQGHVFLTARRESTFAPSYHFVTDFETEEAWTNLPGGPSESRFSRYYRSDIPLWLDGEYKRLAPS